jgi:hypothetical protein
MKTTQTLGWVIAALTTLGLGACGGGDASPTAAADASAQAAPPTALSNALAVIEASKGQQYQDVVDPKSLQQQLPPSDDTIEPTPIG